MANRVEYIKISRIDENGNNLTNTLESLTQLTIPYSNGNNAVYPIEGITRYSDYFLYQVGPANYTPNSADAGKLEYKFTSSISTSTISHNFGFPDFSFYTIPLTTPTNDPFGFYNPNNGSYVFDTYSQKDLTLEITSSLLNNSLFLTTARVSVFVVDPVSVTPNDILSQNGMLATELYGLFGTYPFNKTVTIPSESIAPGNEIRLILSSGAGGAGNRSIKFDPGAEFKISSTAATGPTLSTIPEPYLTSRFYGGDCDILLNNVELYQENPFLQDLDYSTNPNVPVNFEQIISGSATKGTVPESFFTVKSILNPTYESVNTVSEYNKEESAFTTQVSSGVFVAYFDSYQTIQNFNQEKYQTRFNLKYLITPEEELIEISNDPDILYTLLYNFGTNANPNITYPTLTNRFGQIDGSVKLRATTFSTGSFDTSGDANPLEWKGDYINFLYQGNIQGIAYTTGSAPGISGSASEFQNVGGILFPASIGLTSAAELPSKAKEILTKNNIIAPSNTTS